MNTKQGILLVGISLLIFCAFTSLASAKMWYVDDDGGPGINFMKIQDAIDAASDRDMVFVYDGTYYENINLKDGVQILGAGADVTTIDGGPDWGAVVYAIDVGPNTVLDGFTITNGWELLGGGIHMSSSSATVSNNVIVNNHADHVGGGIFIEGSSPILTNNVIISNTAIEGGGIGIVGSSPKLRNNTIANNRAEFDGGGIYTWESSFTISNNTIIGNSADSCGGGICIYEHSAPLISNNLIIGNSAPNGGAIFGEGDVSPKIINNNIYGNSVDGVHRGDDVSIFTITNNIIWGNGDDLYGCTATYSDIEDGDPGEGNICIDPMFVDAAGSDFHLQASSPCIDAGTNEGAPSTDFDGNPRPIDGDGDGIAIVDMGAFEYNPESMIVKVNIDPDTLNLKSKGKWMTAYIELPAGYDVREIGTTKVNLVTPSGETAPIDPSAPATIGDYNSNGILDLMVKFDRAAVVRYLDGTRTDFEVALKITGNLMAGTRFEGIDTIRVVNKGK